MWKKLTSFKGIYGVCTLFAIALLITEAILHRAQLTQPCASIYLERLIMLALIICLFGTAMLNHSHLSRKLCSWLCLLICLVGLYVSGKQVGLEFGWFSAAQLASLTPAQLQHLPISALLKAGLFGTSQCTQPDVLFFNIDFSIFRAGFFLLVGIISFTQARREFLDELPK